ncbi:phosphatase 2C isoform A [Micractinium conductrix]|uniref:protein-serine/threonine phosphatase n=1 Tax=Micractinium conductrix TaxID=554055 RepID=A0A2P6VJ19_9CHLO|nr:phosphatase 2C isoform B [Micractinium conductrix]PSC74096.1 phosphatase 2C isoform A [Micractinium conductrix]|eukprot:PSC74095.1 phosphatase 2C isoform B [Micractinium conductrix]
MGQYLAVPVTDKETLSGQHERLGTWGISAHQGWRKNMEDAHIALHMSDDCHLFGVFDGHGGPEVAKFCSKRMPTELQACSGFKEGRFEECLKEVFHRMDELMRSREGFTDLEALRRECEGGKDGEGEGEDTYDMLRKLVQLQRMAGQNGGAAQEGKEGAGAGLQPEVTVQAGCTAVVALIVRDMLYVANAGDSRAVLCRGSKALPMSEDHKPAAPDERARIMAAGGFLSEIGGITRVNGNLNLSRAIGDLRYKMNSELEPKDQIITAEPDIMQQQLTPDDRFLVLACDGIWDVMTNQQVVDFVAQRLAQGQQPQDISSELLNACLASDPREARGIGCDNMTAAIVVFEPGKPIRSGSCSCSTHGDEATAAAHGAPPPGSTTPGGGGGGGSGSADTAMRREATPPPQPGQSPAAAKA